MAKRTIESRIDFLSPLSVIPGLGPKRVVAFHESGIYTIGDLLYHFPRRYIDRSVVVPIREVGLYKDRLCCIVGTIERTRLEKGRRSRLRILVADETGSIEAVWFQGLSYYRKSIYTGRRVLLTGKVTYYGRFQMAHPSLETISKDKPLPDVVYLPQYSLTGALRDAGVQQRFIVNAIEWVLKTLTHYPQVLPASIEEKKSFFPLRDCIREIHIPTDLKQLDRYRERLCYEELFQLARTLQRNKKKFALPGVAMNPGELPKRLRESLPFTLTLSQEQAIAELYADGMKQTRMHRLLQGDVGSGKTIVALFGCLPALNEGMQVAWLTPTELLAQQTHKVLSQWLSHLGFQCTLLTGSFSAADKRHVSSGLQDGTISFVVGTHALIMSSVRFHSLGMIVIDEQHRFGAQQRLALQEKGIRSDFLLMSATPIPQTLAKTLYGDLDLVTIDKVPDGRYPVATHLVPESKRTDMERFIANEVTSNSARVYYVVPRIESESDTGDDTIKDVETVVSHLRCGVCRSVTSAPIHGQVKAEEKERIMREFAEGTIQLLVATTVIEVGVDIPEATIMVIENAERFGLAQLHQLRGRVGRGSQKSYCFLLTTVPAEDPALERLQLFCRFHDGFKIAEYDLRFRGPGEVVGFRQSGWDNLKIADIVRDAEMFKEIQNELDLLENSKKKCKK